jgi:hypothetical protein
MRHEAEARCIGYVTDGWQESLRRKGAGYDLYLYGPAGTGKSTMARIMVEHFSAITGDASILAINGGVPWFSGPLRNEVDVTGYKDALGRYIESTIARAFRSGGVLLLDEMDGSDASVLLLLNDALANRQLSTADGIVHMDGAPLLVIGTGNTVASGADNGYTRNAQDVSTLDRMTCVPIGYDANIEVEMAGSVGLANFFRNVRSALNKDGRDYPITYRSMARTGRAFPRCRDASERAQVLYDCTPLHRVQPDVVRLIARTVASGSDGSSEYESACKALAWLSTTLDNGGTL